MQEFNKETFETMYNQVSKIKSIYEVCEYCKEGNKIANKEYLKKYPTHKDLLSIFECAVSILEFNILNDYKKHIVENALNDIEFMIGQNILTEAHVQRLLLSPITLQKFPIFKKKFEDFGDRLSKLYECDLERYYYNYDEFKAMLPFNYHQLESYLRYNKIGYEEELIDSDINGDYVQETFEINLNDAAVINTDKSVKEKYKCIENINIIDKFKLEQHGIKPIIQQNNLFVHYINGKQFNVYKQDNHYYMISESLRSYKFSLSENQNNNELISIFDTKTRM